MTDTEMDVFFLKITKMQSDLRVMFPKLNNGGCGIFSILFYKMVKNKFPKIKLVVFGKNISIKVKKRVASNVKNNGYDPDYNPNVLACNHHMILVGDHYIDGHNTFHKSRLKSLRDDYGYYGGKYTVEELKLALKYGCWNPTWKTEMNKGLRIVMETHMKKYLTTNLVKRKY